MCLTRIKARRRLSAILAAFLARSREMSRLMMTLFSMIATTLMGVGVVIALTTGYDTLQPIVIAAAVGFVLAIPVSWLIARQLE
jgi:predicted PurR-regulated permease PerM